MDQNFKLPIYEALFAEDNASSVKLSLVEWPAIEVNFLKFAKDTQLELKFSVEDEDQHIVYGPAMIPDLPIYRYDESGEYYVKFSKDTVAKMAKTFLDRHMFNIEHSSDARQVEILESYIVDKTAGLSPAQFSSLPDGTWMVRAKVNDPALWQSVKDGKLNGFSIEGMISLSRSKEQKYSKKMTITKLKVALAKLLASFASVVATKDDVEYSFEYADELVDGTEVSIIDEAGNIVHPEDGIYVIEGERWEVKDGIIKKVSEDEAPAETEAPAEMAEDEAPEEDPEEVSPEDEAQALYEDLSAKIAELFQSLEEMSERVAALENDLNAIDETMAKMAKQTAPKIDQTTLKEINLGYSSKAAQIAASMSNA